MKVNYIEAIYSKRRVIAIILAILLVAGFGAAVAIIFPPHTDITMTTTLILALALSVVAFFSVCLFSPFIGLILALVLLYNPYYLYIYPFTHGWDGGGERIVISASLIVLLITAILIRVSAGKEISRFRTPLDKPLIIFAIFPLIGLVYGFLQGNETSGILADLFSFVEFYCFFFIVTFVVKTEKQLKTLLWVAILWGTIVCLSSIILYLAKSQAFSLGILLGDMVIPRLNDYMPALLLPPLLAMIFYAKRKGRALLYLPIAVFTIALTFSYFRSLWIGVLVALIFILVLVKGPRLKLKRAAALLAVVLLALLPMNFLTHHFGIIDEQVTIYEVVAGRALQTVGVELPGLATPGYGDGGGNGGGETMAERIERLGTMGRFQDYWNLLNRMISHPLVGTGLGEADPELTFGHTLSFGHNYYLHFGCQLGLPALLFFLLLGLFFFKQGIKKFKNTASDHHKGLILGIMASFVSIGIAFFMFPNLLQHPTAAYLGMGAALLFITSVVS